MRRSFMTSTVFVSAAVAGLALAAMGARLAWSRTDPIVQPVQFNHKVHATEGLECGNCHALFAREAASGRPSLRTCAKCHTEAAGESAEEAKVVEYVASGREIPWQRLYRVPPDVYFSHRRHVTLGGLTCETCHGSIGEMAAPPERPLTQLSMTFCTDCHGSRGITNDCLACHR